MGDKGAVLIVAISGRALGRGMGFCRQLVGASRVGRNFTTEPELHGFWNRIRHRYNCCQQSQHQFVHRRPELQIRRLGVLIKRSRMT
jgi:hypothetical protein